MDANKRMGASGVVDLRVGNLFDAEKPAVKLARLFHEKYESLAPRFGYTTRDDTKKFDANSPNGQLMIAVCESIIEEFGYKFSELIDYK